MGGLNEEKNQQQRIRGEIKTEIIGQSMWVARKLRKGRRQNILVWVPCGILAWVRFCIPVGELVGTFDGARCGTLVLALFGTFAWALDGILLLAHFGSSVWAPCGTLAYKMSRISAKNFELKISLRFYLGMFLHSCLGT